MSESAKIEGTIPDWLRGEVVRTCPAVFETTGWRARHWFDGLGMIYAFRIEGSAVDFRSRLLDSETARDAWHGKANLGSFGTPTKRPLLQRIFRPVARISDNTNVNIVRLGRELVALTVRGYIDHFDWHPKEGTRFVVIARSGGSIREHVAEAFFGSRTSESAPTTSARCIDES